MKNRKSIGAYILSCISYLAIIGLLFAPLLTYKEKSTGEKLSHDVNIITLFDDVVSQSWMAVFLIVVVAIGFISLLLAYFYRNISKAHETFTTLVLVASATLFVSAFMIRALFDYYASEGYTNIPEYRETGLAWGFAVIALLSALIFLSAISFSKYSNQSTQSICENGILIAAALVLGFIKIPLSAQGGSINLQMLPLMVIALRRGPVTGFVCGGIIYGLLSILADGYPFATYPFDYVIGFGSVGIMGLFNSLIFPKENKPLWQREIWVLIGGILVTLMRFIGSTTSSIVIYKASFLFALDYNSIYIPVSGAIAVAALMFLLPSITYINRRYPAKEKTA